MYRKIGWLALCLALVLLAAAPALAMTEERAQALVKAADPKAQKARQFWVYPEGDGAWVFYGTGYNSKQALFKGGFWYVTEEKQYPLGSYTENVSDWDYFECDPPVFCSCTVYDGARHPHAAILKDGAPLEIKDFGTLNSLDCWSGSLCGLANGDNDRDGEIHWVFLGIQDDRMVEIAATPIDEAQAREIEGMDEIIEELYRGNDVLPGGVTATGFLFRNAVPGQLRSAKGHLNGSVTLIVDDNGTPGYVYVFINADGAAYPERGWENEIAIWHGVPQARCDVGLEIVETVTE